MKKNILIILCILFNMYSYSQISLIHDYDSASTISAFSGGVNQLIYINLEVSGERYIKISRSGKKISIYNLNHSLLKTIPAPFLPSNTSTGDILYLSEKLFDLDNKMEFMLINNDGNTGTYYTAIYNEDGALLFSDTGAAMIKMNVPLQQYPIYNTSQGTIMILSYRYGHAKVFSLPGILSTAIEQANGQLIQAQSGQLSNLYPNPSNGAVTLQYELPKEERQGELILYNMQGAEVKRYKVDNTFKDVIIDNTQLPAGTYFYQLQTSKGAVGTKKMVVVK